MEQPLSRRTSSYNLWVPLPKNGFNCREQTSQATGRKVPHLAQVIR